MEESQQLEQPISTQPDGEAVTFQPVSAEQQAPPLKTDNSDGKEAEEETLDQLKAVNDDTESSKYPRH